MLHSLRQRLQQYAEREAAGESLWTPAFSERVRTRVMHVVRRATGQFVRADHNMLFQEAQRLIIEQEGVYTLTGTKRSPSSDLFEFFQSCSDAMFPTVLEALVVAFDNINTAESDGMYYSKGYAATFSRDVNDILAQERVGWELTDGHMIAIHSKELHEAAVEPALRLLYRREFAKADKAYREALEELAKGKAWDAITDAGTALQEALTALGCEGDQLGDLIRSAKKKGLLAPHDDPLTQAIEKLLHWVAADRSQMGDAHHATEATREDAWLIVHVVGAVIVRFASGVPRK